MPELSAKMVFKLKQQTPMIHFQYDQTGAAIRGSELKPKLDKFLYKKYGSEIKSSWRINESAKDEKVRNALNYKVRVFADSNQQKVEEPPKYGMYFGNVGKSLEYKYYVFYKEPIILEIICLFEELRQKIKESIEEFFLVTNFGTRQSKGFGCFTLVEGPKAKAILDKGNYNYFYTTYSKEDYSALLDITKVIMDVMKGGINFNGVYIKGYIQREYLNDIGEKNIGSDKAFIKDIVWKANPRPKERKEPYPEHTYVRALLGVSERITFKDDLRKGDVKIEPESEEVNRFQSPITVSIVGKYIFFIITDSDMEICGEKFKFSHGDNSKEISVPEGFEADLFMDKFVEYFNSPNTKKEFRNKKMEKIILTRGGDAK